ncbi:hypothetical protein ABEV00_12950 [Paenibacillus thiaminolyticus]|uniref:hypothetical protein n=1 Tax=Paenibacillus thiaminolyticus TaxID=49283 RepID=UPI003D2C311A
MTSLKEYRLPEHAVKIGSGQQGTVYRIAADRCVKLYAKARYAELECEAYCRAEGSPILPDLYEAGADYIIMEYLDGETMQSRLRRTGRLTREDAAQILDTLDEMKKRKFARIDIALFHLFFYRGGKMEIIDLVHAYTQICAVPIVLAKGLRRMNLLESFLEHVESLDSKRLRDWDELIKRSG